MVDLTQRGIKNIIKYSGLNDLDLMEQTKLKNIAEKEYDILKRMYNNIMDLSINIKVYDKEKRKKYSVHARIEGPSKIFSASDADWDINTVTRSVLIKLRNELQKQFKEEGKRWVGIKALFKKFKF